MFCEKALVSVDTYIRIINITWLKASLVQFYCKYMNIIVCVSDKNEQHF